MIYGVTGLLDGGKSYVSVLHGLFHIKKGGVWATNITINVDLAAAFCGVSVEVFNSRYHKISWETDGGWWDWPCGDARSFGKERKFVLITIDEAGEWFLNLSATSKEMLSDFCTWLRRSNKRGQDVHLIVADASALAKQGRVLVHRWIYVRNMRYWRIPDLGWKLPPPWCNEFHELEYDVTGEKLISRTIFVRDKRVFNTYDTSAIFDTLPQGVSK